jgi:hypothetical protein
MSRVITAFGATFVLALGIAFAIDDIAAMPDVYVSYSTNECVKVVNYADTKYACENLPKRFNHIWVQ